MELLLTCEFRTPSQFLEAKREGSAQQAVHRLDLADEKRQRFEIDHEKECSAGETPHQVEQLSSREMGALVEKRLNGRPVAVLLPS